MSDPLDMLFQSADSDAWKDLMNRAEASQAIPKSVEAAVYAAAFSTPAGKAVLADLYHRYVNVTRAVPGAGADAAFYREGMAQVVFDIVHQINQAHEEET